MEGPWRKVPGSVTAPKGYLAGGVFCDIKRLGTGLGSEKGRKLDLALVVSEAPAAVAGLFTTNQVCAAPVKISLLRARHGVAQAIVANSGNANACTGQQGLRDARVMTDQVARLFHLDPEHVLVGSTGRIGLPLPMKNVRQGIAEVARRLGASPAHDRQVAEAIMTSDTHPKQLAVELELGGRVVRLGGVCKGAGMIQPGLSVDGKRPAAQPPHATMLAFLTTDAAVSSRALRSGLSEAVAQSFNRITIDGDMSTNDTVLLLANGAAGNRRIRDVRSSDFARFRAALNWLTLELAKMLVRDGEGASRFVTVRVAGARSFIEADAAARAVANSALVKTSWCGGDPNWGRILDALGYSAATVVEEKVDLAYRRLEDKRPFYVLRGGQPVRAAFADLCRMVAGEEFELRIDLHLGRASAVIYASDLTEEYVTFNKGDVGNPAALGG